MDDENLSPPARTPPPFRLWPWAKAPPWYRARWEGIPGHDPGVAPDFVVELPPQLAAWRDDLLGTMPGVTVLAATEDRAHSTCIFLQRAS